MPISTIPFAIAKLTWYCNCPGETDYEWDASSAQEDVPRTRDEDVNSITHGMSITTLVHNPEESAGMFDKTINCFDRTLRNRAVAKQGPCYIPRWTWGFIAC